MVFNWYIHHCILIAFRDVIPTFTKCLVCAPLWPEAKTPWGELRLVKQAQLLCYALLDNPVYYRGDTQPSTLSVLFGYLYPADRIGAVFAPLNGCYQLFLSPDKIVFQ